MGKDEIIIEKAVNTIRAIGTEMISEVKSGHSGIVLGAAPALYSIYNAMKFNPKAPDWFNRDRFVMSAGHGSALLYSVLHFMGFDIPADDLKTFRKLHSKLAGHPELFTPGVDAATGPLGQGIAMAVGMAMAEKRLNAMDKDAVDHYTFCLVGDGCLQEGVSYEACNLAGLWKLNKLIVVYDSNDIQLDGECKNVNAENVRNRFEAAGWHVIEVADGMCVGSVSRAIEQAKASSDAPTLIVAKTAIGFGAKTQGTSKAHGQVLTREEIQDLRKSWGLTTEYFGVDVDVQKHFAAIVKAKIAEASKPQKALSKFMESFLSAQELDIKPEHREMSGRDAGHAALQQIAKQRKNILGGSADVASSTQQFVKGGGMFSAENPLGTDVAFGVREFAMAAIMNGAALHGFRPYVSCFLVFSDYCKAAMRVSALMGLPVVYIYTHDGLGSPQDGPTHQGCESIAALRIIPNMTVFRPCDDVEVAAAYKYAFSSNKPSSIVLSRGNTPSLKGTTEGGVLRGGYIVSQAKSAQATLVATGTEVPLCLKAQEMLEGKGISCVVVSLPSTELFDAQDEKYRNSIIKPGLPVVAVEMGNTSGFYKYLHGNGTVIGFDTFGHSGDGAAIMNELGVTSENIVKAVQKLVKKK